MANAEVLRALALRKTYRDFWGRRSNVALDGLDLVVEEGGVHGVLGPNGSGKTTTFRCLLALCRPDSGKVSVLGGDPRDPSVRARVGYLAEDARVFPQLSGREALDLMARLYGIERRERAKRVPAMLERLGLAGAAKRKLGHYSRGMMRRWGLAQAMVHEPRLLILDEPTDGLDPLGRIQFKELVRGIAASGSTVVLSSHLLAEVEHVCDRISVLYRGKALAQGTVKDLLEHRDEARIDVRGLGEAGLAAVQGKVRELGGEVLGTVPRRATLEEVFVRLLGPEGGP